MSNMKHKALDLKFLCCGGDFWGGILKQDYIKTYELIAIKGFEELGGGNGIDPLDDKVGKLCGL